MASALLHSRMPCEAVCEAACEAVCARSSVEVCVLVLADVRLGA